MPVRPEIVGDNGHEEIRTCPYDPSHRILSTRFTRHLVKCQKNHPDVNMIRCPFNASHIIPEEQYPNHIEMCPDKGWIECQMDGGEFSTSVQKPVEHGDVSTPFSNNCTDTSILGSTENWDEERVPNTRREKGFFDRFRPIEQTHNFKMQMIKSLQQEAKQQVNVKRRPTQQPRFLQGIGRGRRNMLPNDEPNVKPGEETEEKKTIVIQNPPSPSFEQFSNPFSVDSVQVAEELEDCFEKKPSSQAAMKKRRKLEKHLRQVQQLEEMKKTGIPLNEEQQAKLSRKKEVYQELCSLSIQ